jgi:hypothetical protein
MWPQKLVFATVLSLGAVAIGFAAGEVMTRLSGIEPMAAARSSPHRWATHDAVLGWVNKPGVFRGVVGTAPMTFWEGGRRATRPDASDGGAGRKQVVLVGGSWTQGFEVDDHRTFAWLLDSAFPRISIANHGTAAYGTYQSLLMLERVFDESRVAPDLVVYGFGYFHAERNVLTYPWSKALNFTMRFAAPHALLDHDGLRRLPPQRLSVWSLERRSALVRGFHDGYLRWLLRDREAQAVPVTRRLLQSMHEFVERMGSRLLVVILGDEGQPRRYTDFMSRERIPFVNCTYPEVITPALRVEGVGHPNHVVHAYWAQCIEKWIDADPWLTRELSPVSSGS